MSVQWKTYCWVNTQMFMHWKWHLYDTGVGPEGRRKVCASIAVLNKSWFNERKADKEVRGSSRWVEGKSKNHRGWKARGQAEALGCFIGFNLGRRIFWKELQTRRWHFGSLPLNVTLGGSEFWASAFPKGLLWGSDEKIYMSVLQAVKGHTYEVLLWALMDAEGHSFIHQILTATCSRPCLVIDSGG